MRKTIQKLTYDTETATELAGWSNDLGASDFSHCSETLYYTRNGAFFVHGEGGPASIYSLPAGSNGSRGGEDIIPKTAEEALAWCEDRECEEAISRHFSSMVEDA